MSCPKFLVLLPWIVFFAFSRIFSRKCVVDDVCGFPPLRSSRFSFVLRVCVLFIFIPFYFRCPVGARLVVACYWDWYRVSWSLSVITRRLQFLLSLIGWLPTRHLLLSASRRSNTRGTSLRGCNASLLRACMWANRLFPFRCTLSGIDELRVLSVRLALLADLRSRSATAIVALRCERQGHRR